MFSTLIRVLLILALAFCLPHPLLGKETTVTAAGIKEAVIKSDVLDREYRQQVYTSYENGVASVSLIRHPEASRADCKIDTVLLARRIIALAPRDIKLVRCVFYDFEQQNQYWEVEVRAQLVQAFAQGKIGEHELIDSVLLSEDRQKNPLGAKFAALSYSGILNESSVCKGACEDRRLAISLRLKEIEKQGVELGHFRDDFLRLEDAARRGKAAELIEQISTLNKSLDDYVQEMINAGRLQKPELHRAKNALGVKGEARSQPGLGL
jgi:hypothetical protein